MGGTSKASPSLLGKVFSIPIGPHEYFVQEPDRLEVDFFCCCCLIFYYYFVLQKARERHISRDGEEDVKGALEESTSSHRVSPLLL